MKDTTLIGNTAEARILAFLVSRGYTVSIPCGGGSRYDLVVDTPLGLKRLQCKKGRLVQGCISFKVYSQPQSGTAKRIYLETEIDHFAVWCPEVEGIFIVPVKLANKSDMRLRLAPFRNGQKKGINLAEQFWLR